MTFLKKKNVFFMINESKYIIYVKLVRGDRIPLKCYYITAKSKGMFEVSGPLFQLIFPSKMLAILGRLEMGQKNRAL